MKNGEKRYFSMENHNFVITVYFFTKNRGSGVNANHVCTSILQQSYADPTSLLSNAIPKNPIDPMPMRSTTSRLQRCPRE